MRDIVVGKQVTYEGIKTIGIAADSFVEGEFDPFKFQYILKQRKGQKRWHVHLGTVTRDKDLWYLCDYTLEKINMKLSDAKKYAIEELEKYLQLLSDEPKPPVEGLDVTTEKLSEARYSARNKSHPLYSVVNAKAGKSMSATEKKVLEKVVDGTDLGASSNLLLYAKPLHSLDKNSHKAVIKLLDRRDLKIIEVESKKRPGFTYIIRKS